MRLFLKASLNINWIIVSKTDENMPDSFPTDVDIFYRNVTEKDLDRIVKDIFTKYRIDYAFCCL